MEITDEFLLSRATEFYVGHCNYGEITISSELGNNSEGESMIFCTSSSRRKGWDGEKFIYADEHDDDWMPFIKVYTTKQKAFEVAFTLILDGVS